MKAIQFPSHQASSDNYAQYDCIAYNARFRVKQGLDNPDVSQGQTSKYT